MKIRDIFELARLNYKKQFTKNLGLMLIFVIVIVVFNITFSLTKTISENTSSNIVDNQNLKIIKVSSVEDGISEENLEYISKLSHVEMTVYDYCLPIALEEKGMDLNVIGMNDSQASYLVGEKLTLNDNSIVLNTSYQEMGYQIGDEIEISFNSRIADASGIRVSQKLNIIGFYEQPTIDSWYESVALVSPDNIYLIASNVYGVSEDEFRESNLYKQHLLVFVDDVDMVGAIAKEIEERGFISSYALAYSEELPVFAKAVLTMGIIIIVVFLIMGIVVMNATLNNSIKNRYKEIGILKSLGMTGKEIFSILSAEVFLLWLIISITATILSGVAFCILQNNPTFQLMGKLHVNMIQMLLTLLATFAVMFLTTLYTNKKASELKIIEVLRNE